MLPALSTIWAGVWMFLSTPSTDVLSLTAIAAIAVLAMLTAGALRRAAAKLGTTSGPAIAHVAAAAGPHGVPRLCDPDAAGRPRPRAPSADPAA